MARQPDQPVNPTFLALLGEHAEEVRDLFPADEPTAEACLTRAAAAIVPVLPVGTKAAHDLIARELTGFMGPLVAALGTKKRLTELLLCSDLTALLRRMGAVNHILDTETPSYTLEELATHFESFLRFLFQQKTHLLITGLVTSRFTPNPWLFHKLGRLYDTKATASDWPYEDALGRGSKSGHRSRSRRRSKARVRWLKTPTGVRSIFLEDFQKANHDEADLLNGLDPFHAERLEGLRPRFHKFKMETLRPLASALKRGSAVGMRDECFRLIRQTLSGDEVGFLFRMDRYYLGRDAMTAAVEADDPRMIPGGLTDVIDVVAHTELELTLGRYSSLRNSLDLDTWYCLTDTEYGYVELLRRGDHTTLDSALDRFLDIESEVFAHGEQFRSWVRSDLWTGYANHAKPLLPPVLDVADSSPVGDVEHDLTPADQAQGVPVSKNSFLSVCP